MKKNLIRLFFAAILSLACFGATTYWYQKTNPANSNHAGKKPIAFVNHTKDEIHRRPVTRLIWQLINEGEPVYPGEALRTSSAGEARIQFADSNRFIDLEPDSLIVITQSSNKEISLDLMDGGVTVNQGVAASSDAAVADNGLTLKSGNTKVDLSQATASLSKSGGKIDVQVLKGKAKVDSNGQTKDLESGKTGSLGADGIQFDLAQLQILSPALDRTTFQDSENPEGVQFAWKGFPPKSIVTVEAGKSRKTLKPVGETSEDKITFQLPTGKHFWKLVAKDPQTHKVIAESTTYPIEIANRYPPFLLSPTANEKWLNEKPGQAIEFKWSRPERSKSILLEVARDEELKNKLVLEHFETGESYSANLADGKYYVRISASFEDSKTYLPGKIQKFQVTSKRLSPVKIEWSHLEEKLSLPYAGPLDAAVNWDTQQKDQVKTWRIKLAENKQELTAKDAPFFETKDPTYKLNFKKPGRYLAMVEALDETNTLLASSAVKTIEVELPPLLPAPQFLPAEGDLKADSDGRLNLQWNPIDGAKEYSLTLINPKNKENKTAKMTKTSTSLVNLMPGQLKVEITAIDNYGRVGAKEIRTVVVPDVSALATPKVRKIKVK